MRPSYTVPAVVFILALSGCATRTDFNYLSYQIEELNARVPKLEKELGVVKNATKEGLDNNLKDLRADLDTIRRGTADLQANIEAVRVDMQVVSGKLDDTAMAAKRPADDLALLREDIDRRTAALETRLTRLEKTVEEQQRKVVETPEVIYQRGLDAFKKGDLQKSRELLSGFIETHPTHDLVANAHYWLGETYFGEKKFDQAALEFQEVIKNFPTKDKVPAAMLKQAMAFKELGDTKSARYLYKKLADQFPDMAEAQTAKEKLKELK